MPACSRSLDVASHFSFYLRSRSYASLVQYMWFLLVNILPFSHSRSHCPPLPSHPPLECRAGRRLPQAGDAISACSVLGGGRLTGTRIRALWALLPPPHP